MAESKIKYYYFDVYGRGELNRLILGYNKVNFEDVRLNKETWPTFKATTKFGQLPILEVDGKQIAQSNVIARYLAQKYNQYPTDPEKALEVEELRDFFVLDLNEVFNRHWYLKDDAKTSFLKTFFEETLPKKLEILESILKKGNGEFLVGNSVTLIDFYAIEFSQRVLFNDDWKERAAPALEKFEALQNYYKKRFEDSNYAEYVKTRVNH